MRRLNFQKCVTIFFESHNHLIVRFPIIFIVLPPIITVLLVSVTAADFELNISNDSLQVFLPDDMQSLKDLKKLISLFPPTNPQRDTYSILGSKFAYTIIELQQGNILEEKNIGKVAKLHHFVKNLRFHGLTIQPKWQIFEIEINEEKKQKLWTGVNPETAQDVTYRDVCLLDPVDHTCTINPIAYALEDDDPYIPVRFLLRYPGLKIFDFYVDNAVVYGGVKLKNSSKDSAGNSIIESCTSIRIVYVIENTERGESWLNVFLDRIGSFKMDGVNIFWSSSKSLAKEMERNGNLLIPFMPWNSLLLIVFCMLACSSWNNVRSQPWIGFFAMFNSTMATIASTSLLLYLRYPFLPLVFIMPFLVISIGTDNMFLMLKSWRMTDPKVAPKQRYVDALTESASSLFLTSLTDGLSFAIGSISEFHAVRVFCTYCAMAILFMFLFQITFFNSIMVWCCQRELKGNHALFCWKPAQERKPTPLERRNVIKTCKLGKILAIVLKPMFSRIIVLMLFIIYISVSIYYLSALPLGLDLKLLTPDDSYAAKELDAQERLFADYGGYCFAVLRTDDLDLENAHVRSEIIHLYRKLASSKYASEAEFWMVNFETKFRWRNFTASQFQDELHTFLAQEEFRNFRTDIRFAEDGSILAVKMLLRIRNLGSQNDAPRATFLRETMEKSGFDGFVYDTSFLLVDQQLTTVFNVIVNVISAIITMLAICILMVPRPVSAICIGIAILSVNVGVVGCLSAASTRLDIISMITIVMSVGFSVDYVTHTTYHYVIQKDNRLENCLQVMTEPILQSAFSTIVGVCLLALVPSYIVRTFVYTVFFVVLIGLLHALIFIPVLLHTVVPKSEILDNSEQKPCHIYDLPHCISVM